jgi:hypothetical protein
MGTAVDWTAYLKNQLNQIHQVLSTHPNSTDVFLCNPKDLKHCCSAKRHLSRIKLQTRILPACALKK